jgi:hypothetical protein
MSGFVSETLYLEVSYIWLFESMKYSVLCECCYSNIVFVCP